MLVVAILFGVRFSVLNEYEAPPSADMGNQLTFLHAFQGNDVTSLDLRWRYPPLYFILVLAPFVQFLQAFTALKVVAALISSMIVVPFFLVARKITNSNIVAFLTAAIFAFTEGHSEMLGWGAIPTFLGIFFMLMSTYYVIDVVERYSTKSLLLAGLFFSLTAGSHHFVFFYYVLTLLFFALFSLLLRRKLALPAIKTLFLITVVGTLFSVPYIRTYATIMDEGIFTKFDNGHGYVQLVNFNIIADSLRLIETNLYIYAIIAVVGLFVLWKKFRKKYSGIMILSLASSVLALLSVFSYAPVRAAYFVYTPLLLLFSISLSEFLQEEKTIMIRKKAHMIFPIALIAIITSTLLIASYSRYLNAVGFYQCLGSDEIEALDWLREITDSKVVTLTNNARLAWWIEGYAMRKSYTSTSFQLFTYEDQIRESEIANKIMAGNHIIEKDYMWISDYFPAAFYNPKITINSIMYHPGDTPNIPIWIQDLIYFNDASAELELSPRSNPDLIWKLSPLYAESKSMDLENSSDSVTLSYTYSWYHASIIRTVEVTSSSCIAISFNVTLMESFMRSFRILASVSPYAKIEDYSIANDSVRLRLSDFYGRITEVKIECMQINGQTIDEGFTYRDAHFDVPSSYYVFNTTSSNLYVRFLVSVEQEPNVKNHILRYQDAYELIRTNNIRYIVLSKVGDDFYKDVHRFTYQTSTALGTSFENVFENSNILVLEVKYGS